MGSQRVGHDRAYTQLEFVTRDLDESWNLISQEGFIFGFKTFLAASFKSLFLKL